MNDRNCVAIFVAKSSYKSIVFLDEGGGQKNRPQSERQPHVRRRFFERDIERVSYQLQ